MGLDASFLLRLPAGLLSQAEDAAGPGGVSAWLRALIASAVAPQQQDAANN
jgi:hypothetical protein